MHLVGCPVGGDVRAADPVGQANGWALASRNDTRVLVHRRRHVDTGTISYHRLLGSVREVAAGNARLTRTSDRLRNAPVHILIVAISRSFAVQSYRWGEHRPFTDNRAGLDVERGAAAGFADRAIGYLS